MKRILLIGGILLSSATHQAFAEEQCGKVTIADMNCTNPFAELQHTGRYGLNKAAPLLN